MNPFKSRITQLLVLLFVFCLPVAAICNDQSTPPIDIEDQIDDYLDTQVKEHGIPGITVAVVANGGIIYHRAIGVRRLGSDEKLTTGHAFHMASVSKPFVATAIMQLVEEKKIDLDAPVIDYLPYFQLDDDRYRSITIRQMLNHTSGMPDVEDYEWDKPQFDKEAAERYVRQMATEKMLWGPGEGVRYSNMAFDALAVVIARVSGMSFESYVDSRILQPLGMVNSSFLYPIIAEDLRTSGHVGNPAQVSDVYPYNRRHAPSSTLNSSVMDMTNWLLANLNRGEHNGQRILQSSSYDLLWTGTVEFPDYPAMVGLSWFVDEDADADAGEGNRFVFHGGGDTGFRSFVLMEPDANVGVVIASNWGETDSAEIAFSIIDLVLADL